MPSRETPNQAHDSHDRLLVARFAAGDAYQAEIDQAQRLVDSCPECASLAADIRLISASTSELNQIRRPRDFRITPEQAEKLRGSWLDRLMRGIAAPGWTVVRPLAGAALAIAVVFVVVGALPLGNLRGGAAPEAAPALSGTSGAFVADRASPLNFSAAPAAAAPSPLDNPDLPAPSMAAAPASVPTGPEIDASSTVAPGAGMSMSTEMPTDVTVAPESTARETEASLPAKAIESAAPPPAAPTAGEAIVEIPTAQPSHAPAAGAPAGNALVTSVAESSVDRTAFLAGGLLLGFLALMALAFVWIVRRRYSDPLVR